MNQGSLRALIFVDCEATGPCPGLGELTEFGAVHYETHATFHGVLHETELRPGVPIPIIKRPYCAVRTGLGMAIDLHTDCENPKEVFSHFAAWLRKQVIGRPCFVSDNPAFDWQWINYHFHHHLFRNPFGHSARRIGDFYAGLQGDFMQSNQWKRLRRTAHDHNPVHDALGNVEAFEQMVR